MKKVIASAVGLALVGGVAVTTASAVENQFGGYWRTRAYGYENMQGVESASSTFVVDNRTRLYYTAKFNDDFKFVNKFEFNTKWGDTVGGDIGADGTGIWRIKNSYADFNLGMFNFKLGIQGAAIARGFLFDDDFSGALVTGKFGNVNVTGGYIAVKMEDAGADADRGYFTVLAPITVSDSVSLTPYFLYDSNSQDAVVADDGTVTAGSEWDNYYLGLDADLKFGSVGVWGTAIYNFGELNDADISAFLVAAGVDAGIAHGQAFYATGDDADEEVNGFVSAAGQCYYWSEIMGYGIFDAASPALAGECGISNIGAFNAGVTIKPMDKLTVSADVWYAMLAEENARGEDELGWEFDGQVSYALMDNLSLDLVLAYLVSGEAFATDTQDAEDIIEGGARISLKF